MKEENAIEVHNVKKKFRVYLDRGYTLKELTLFKKRRKYQEREVLKGISFEVKRGEAIGLIGQNGCGKSTTLKLLTRIMYPDSGEIQMRGRASSLIELGAGFHPDMSGRQNIYTNASIFGLTKKEIDKRIEDIIAFSELREFIDNPVRTYSSGMYMRLAFAVAINVDADILLIDEILAVGDAAFQAKCFNRLREIKASGTTIIIVSHSMGQIEQICDRAIWIKDGEIEEDGKPRDIIQTYMSWIMEGDKFLDSEGSENYESEKKDNHDTNDKVKLDGYEYTSSDILRLKKEGRCVEIGNKDVEILDYELLDATSKKQKNRFAIGDSMLCRIYYKRNNPQIKETMCSFSIYRNDGLNCYSTNSFINTGKNIVLSDCGIIEFIISDSPFMQGEYKIDLSLNKDYGPTYHGYLNACAFTIFNVTTDYGVCRPHITWNEKELDSTKDRLAIHVDNYRMILNIRSDLVLDKQAFLGKEYQNAQYDLIIVPQSVHELYLKENIIITALEIAKYILIEDADIYRIPIKISNCYVFKTKKFSSVLIPLSTKNKELLAELLWDFKEKNCMQGWLLEKFRIGELTLDARNNEKYVVFNLINKTEKNIKLLDKGVAFGYKIITEQNKKEGEWIPLRTCVYPGDNLYEIEIEDKNAELEISIVKEGEFWLSDLMPETTITLKI